MSCQQQGTSATDVITYIGVPLAVLGVLPILWNVIRSFWIRHYLVSLIPTKARKNVSLTLDPASGVVIVGLDKLELTSQGVLSYGRRPKTLAARKVQQISTGLVGCSWMGLYATGIPTSKIGGGTQRVIVDASLRFESLGVHCDKQTLLFLALGLGVDPFRNQLRGISQGTLIDVEEKPVITIRTAAGDSTVELLPGLSFSERRALAWFYVMVVQDSRGLSYIPLALSKNSRSVNTAMLPGIISIKENLEQLEKNGVSLELALRWTCYVESVFYDEGNYELLPVPQTLLGAREDALTNLQSLNIDHLGAHLQVIFDTDSNMATKVLATLKKTWLEMVPQIKNGRRQGQRQRSLKDCQTCLHPSTLRRTSGIIRDIYNAVRPDAAQPPGQGPMFDDPASPIVTAARVWVGLSVIQLWRREEWETEIRLDGREVAKPSFEGLHRILLEDEDRPRHGIYIG
ncbi:uncharacterized protein PAC_16886 [Phialocephala subalpina]|uniref:Uncharacterized protein n=1 Tax=Phialocephala subalpina TaxID=576137 RepID=A0A1L7XPX8_9HELO|nr:uncharacterized protein PAC_16886 [Phialocephala subalpina]